MQNFPNVVSVQVSFMPWQSACDTHGSAMTISPESWESR